MDKKFILMRQVIVPILSIVMLLSQACPTYAITGKELTDLMDQSPTLAVEVYGAPSQEPITIAATTEQGFSDVPSSAWYYKDVTEARRLGIIDGVGHNKYSPNESITYAQYLKIISAILDESVNTSPVSSPWYNKYIESSKVLGAVDKKESVPATISIPREMMIKYTCKALGIDPYTGNEVVFNDVKPADSAWINAGYNEYLIEGGGHAANGLKVFGMGEYATRAQLASMALRIKEYKENPVAYKEQAAEVREAADKKYEEQQAALKEQMTITKADISRMMVDETKSALIVKEVLKNVKVNADKTVTITVPDLLPEGWVWMIRIDCEEKDGQLYNVLTPSDIIVGKTITTEKWDDTSLIKDYTIKVNFVSNSVWGNVSAGAYASKDLISGALRVYSHFKQELIEGVWPAE